MELDLIHISALLDLFLGAYFALYERDAARGAFWVSFGVFVLAWK